MFPVELLPYSKDHFPTGSRVICNPPVLDTDEDWAILAEHTTWGPANKALYDKLTELGFTLEGDKYKDASTFNSYRLFNINLIVFRDKREFDKYKLATNIATVLNLTKKEDRVHLFQMIRDGG